MKIMRLIVLVTVLSLTGCTSIEAVPLGKDVPVSYVKIIENPDNRVVDFVPVCIKQFARWGIEAELFPPETKTLPDDYVFTYTTEREWDLKMFLFKAHIELLQNGKVLAAGDYHAIGGMFSLAVTKLNPTSWKMRRVFDKMMRYRKLK